MSLPRTHATHSFFFHSFSENLARGFRWSNDSLCTCGVVNSQHIHASCSEVDVDLDDDLAPDRGSRVQHTDDCHASHRWCRSRSQHCRNWARPIGAFRPHGAGAWGGEICDRTATKWEEGWHLSACCQATCVPLAWMAEPIGVRAHNAASRCGTLRRSGSNKWERCHQCSLADRL